MGIIEQIKFAKTLQDLNVFSNLNLNSFEFISGKTKRKIQRILEKKTHQLNNSPTFLDKTLATETPTETIVSIPKKQKRVSKRIIIAQKKKTARSPNKKKKTT